MTSDTITIACDICDDKGFIERDGGVDACHSCEAGWEYKRRLSSERHWTQICPERFIGYRLETHPNQAAADTVREWLGDGMQRGRNLFLAGTVGSGKTGLAFGAMRSAMLDHHRNVKYGTVAGLLEAMRPGHDTVVGMDLDDLQRVHVLLLDDLGVEKTSEWQAERLYLIVNSRYERQLPTIMTTNMNRKDLEARVGERIMSRLMEDVQVVQMGGDDLRKRGA